LKSLFCLAIVPVHLWTSLVSSVLQMSSINTIRLYVRYSPKYTNLISRIRRNFRSFLKSMHFFLKCRYRIVSALKTQAWSLYVQLFITYFNMSCRISSRYAQSILLPLIYTVLVRGRRMCWKHWQMPRKRSLHQNDSRTLLLRVCGRLLRKRLQMHR